MERYQIPVYLLALLLAGIIGWLWPDTGAWFGTATPVILGLLLYGMFSQIPFLSMGETWTQRRFMVALMVANYIAVPLLVWGLAQLLPDHPPLLLGVYLVLLTPCIDYVIVFTHLGRGDAKLMLMATPMLFVTQMALLPVYLWLFLGRDAASLMQLKPFMEAFLTLIVLPLLLAIGSQAWARRHPQRGPQLMEATAWLPVPFMALTLLAVVASQIGKVYASLSELLPVLPIYIAFMMISPLLSRWIAALFRLSPAYGRTLAFSAGTRNSLVVLPIALALPDPVGGLVAAVIVTQTLVELAGELVYIRLIPRLFPSNTEEAKQSPVG
ncbi:arsenic resistance protein [Paenibacillus daejeonensis]|uniref:arsenic resistance protein n=1 Tax=Paenibacillus daejeonensis TaxID=135193 RepID=UPI000374CBAA|nr:arsenic resistance protein [Paenibacillus daejeonensis]